MANVEKASRLKDVSPEDMTREQLLIRVRQLEKHVTNLRNVINKSSQDGQVQDVHGKRKSPRTFDFKQYNTRHVALKITYLGWDYSGYVTQEETTKTIEANLFDALLKTRLIECREESNYHRCGRTDKGVSAFSQVISLDLRTRFHEGKGVKVSNSLENVNTSVSGDELPYCSMLNRVLPPDIRVLGWCPVDVNFSARFDCKQRTYKYFFPRAHLDIQLMKIAASKLVGTHDFRNLCKMDVGNRVTQFVREIRQVSVNILDDDLQKSEDTNPYTMCEIKIIGNAFLWHQIRCIVAILFMVGEKKEKPEIIDALLDITNNPRKPQYQMASELPLVLFDCQFEDVDWITDEETYTKLLRGFEREWTKSAVKTAMIKSLLGELEQLKPVKQEQEISYHNSHLFAINLESKSKTHKPLLERQLCESLEDRIEYHTKKRKYEQELMASNRATLDDKSSRTESDTLDSVPIEYNGSKKLTS
ncbi:hypothetical protein LSH36_548g04006 [Paralvinella palmiformis]|uniref:Pseudouridine synthase I TruA alpha/beta domain-containing protein n=1 Tax=Paralvinella palmiformis TaxID=53620 RepID=A0AAD9J7G6_9ANNE|nr:hypothetical protein LSH36_548g04006 [Paralvinella palmiformis]